MFDSQHTFFIEIFKKKEELIFSRKNYWKNKCFITIHSTFFKKPRNNNFDFEIK